jgi:dienelactone hydrolase
MRRILDRLDPRDPRGLIAHLQGCPYGPSRMAIHSQARFMASLGYVVVVAEPLAEETSLETCPAGPSDEEAALHQARLRQLDRLVSLAVSLPWVDPRRIFASGFGEGGDAVLAFGHPALRGRVAIAPRCRFGIDRWPVPTLLISTRDDRWYETVQDEAARLRCMREAAYPHADRLEVDGSLHDALVYTEARVALSHFLVRAGYRPAPRLSAHDLPAAVGLPAGRAVKPFPASADLAAGREFAAVAALRP